MLASHLPLTTSHGTFARPLQPNLPNLQSDTGSISFLNICYTDQKAVGLGPSISDSVRRGAHTPNDGGVGNSAKPPGAVPRAFRRVRKVQHPSGARETRCTCDKTHQGVPEQL